MSLPFDGYLDFESGDAHALEKWRASVTPERHAEPLDLNFSSGSDQLTPWRREQAEKLLAIARREGLPIGETVRITLQNDLELTGRLLLDPETHHLRVNSVPFQKSEIVSCVRLE